MFLLIKFGLFSVYPIKKIKFQLIICIYDLKAFTHANPTLFLKVIDTFTASAVTLALKCH